MRVDVIGAGVQRDGKIGCSRRDVPQNGDAGVDAEISEAPMSIRQAKKVLAELADAAHQLGVMIVRHRRDVAGATVTAADPCVHDFERRGFQRSDVAYQATTRMD